MLDDRCGFDHSLDLGDDVSVANMVDIALLADRVNVYAQEVDDRG